MIKILLLILLLTSTAYAQSVTTDTVYGNQQVSPVATLDGTNAPVVNNNMSLLQGDINSLISQVSTLNSINGYFTSGQLNIANGGTGTTTGIIGLGAWVTESSNTVYHAATDGYFTAYGASGSGVQLACLTDSSNPPTTTRSYGDADGTVIGHASCASVVRKGDYWEVTGTGAVYFISTP